MVAAQNRRSQFSASYRAVSGGSVPCAYGPPIVMKNTPSGEGRANAVWLRACFSGECPMGLRPTNGDEKHAGGECRANMAGLRACFSGERLEPRILRRKVTSSTGHSANSGKNLTTRALTVAAQPGLRPGRMEREETASEQPFSGIHEGRSQSSRVPVRDRIAMPSWVGGSRAGRSQTCHFRTFTIGSVSE